MISFLCSIKQLFMGTVLLAYILSTGGYIGSVAVQSDLTIMEINIYFIY